jgi:hypothetical protein
MIGNCAAYSGGREIYAGMNLLVLRPAPDVDPEWLFWLVRSNVFRQEVESLAKPAINQASISQTSLKAIRVPVPDLSAQREIALLVGREVGAIDGLIIEGDCTVSLLQERRSALISAAVTGKIDVRASIAECVA